MPEAYGVGGAQGEPHEPHEAQTGAARRPSGELEASVLAALWAAGGRALTPADVQRDLGADLARTTVTTILARLHDKGAVSRTRAGRGYAYLPAQDSPGLAARRMRSELDKSAEGQRGTVLARFVSELGPADERLLRELLAQAAPPDAQGGDA
ncbi:BlaI/MecI/CopY family transcriptional regulator [Streptomyces sp. NRRL F-5123]|uniref:BlaI/MecI/CopY family transcriptional regulator n=1 Tax=Streptomyces sp. NRRL F-5123 TaxID=1463856 RepID=UPI00099DC763|nr:BlaI/MecI/CopY family transcriptional regulator [Streptomyces sp. NRRL F-5123]